MRMILHELWNLTAGRRYAYDIARVVEMYSGPLRMILHELWNLTAVRRSLCRVLHSGPPLSVQCKSVRLYVRFVFDL